MVKLLETDVTTDEVKNWHGINILHFQGSSCSQKLRIFLNEKKIDWKSYHIDLVKGDNFTKWFLGINPRGVVPVLVDDGEVYIESNDIIQHLDKIINDAHATHSVNTVYLDNNGDLIGENTDVYGIQAAYLNKINLRKKSDSVLIFGAGGVSPSIIYALVKSNLNKISITNRTYEKAIFLKKKFPFIKIIKWEEFNKSIPDFKLKNLFTSDGVVSSLNSPKNFTDTFLLANFSFNTCSAAAILSDVLLFNVIVLSL